MANFEVLSIHPTTYSREYVPAETAEQAQSQKSRAERDGHLLVEIIESVEQHEDWQRRARELVEQLKGG